MQQRQAPGGEREQQGQQHGGRAQVLGAAEQGVVAERLRVGQGLNRRVDQLHHPDRDPDADQGKRVQRALGKNATVYLRIPGQKSGAGKVTVDVNGREVEYEAMTTGPEIATGARVQVVGVLGPDTLEVAEASQVEVSA